MFLIQTNVNRIQSSKLISLFTDINHGFIIYSARTITDFQTFETDLGSNFMPLSYTNITAIFISLVKAHFCLIDINEHKTMNAKCCGTY